MKFVLFTHALVIHVYVIVFLYCECALVYSELRNYETAEFRITLCALTLQLRKRNY